MEWISVKERLPEKFGNYLVFTESKTIEILKYEGIVGIVTHWMPLPPPPEIDKN